MADPPATSSPAPALIDGVVLSRKLEQLPAPTRTRIPCYRSKSSNQNEILQVAGERGEILKSPKATFQSVPASPSLSHGLDASPLVLIDNADKSVNQLHNRDAGAKDCDDTEEIGHIHQDPDQARNDLSTMTRLNSLPGLIPISHLSTQQQSRLRPGSVQIVASSEGSTEMVGVVPSGDNLSAVPDRRGPSDSMSWWEGIVARLKAIELENKGSVARDHLAIERTFLAWVRTSLTFASIGIGITQIFRLSTSPTVGGVDSLATDALRQIGKPLGITFLAASLVVLLLGYTRYWESQCWVMRGKFPASRGAVVLVSIIAFAMMIASLVAVIVTRPTQFEN